MELNKIQSNDEIIKSVVKVKSAIFSHDDKNDILNKCSMTVPYGQIYALLGPSGCGKTTLLRCILGLIIPQQGIVTVLGEHITLSKLTM